MIEVVRTLGDQLRKELMDSIELKTRALVNGSCRDHAEYRYICGFIQGLDAAVQKVTDLVRSVEDASE